MKKIFTLALAAAAAMSASAAAPLALHTLAPVKTRTEANAKVAAKQARAEAKKSRVAARAAAKAPGDIGEYSTLWTGVLDFCTTGTLAAPKALDKDADGYIPVDVIGEANYGFGGTGLYDAGDKTMLVKFMEGEDYGFLFTPDLPNPNTVVSFTFDVQLVAGTSEADDIDVILCEYAGGIDSYEQHVTGNDWTTIKCVLDASQHAKKAPIYFQIYAMNEADILVRNLVVETAEVEVEPIVPLGDITGLSLSLTPEGGIDFTWNPVETATAYMANVDRIHAVEAGEVFGVMSADFSTVVSDGTVAEPVVPEEIIADVPGLPGATAYLPATINGAMGVQSNWLFSYFLGVQAQIQTGFYDLSAAKDGKVDFEVEACSGTGAVFTAGLFAYNEATDAYEPVSTFSTPAPLGTEMQTIKFSLTGATDDCAFLLLPSAVSEEDEAEHNIFFRSIKASIECAAAGEVRVPVASEEVEAPGITVPAALVVPGDTYVGNVGAYRLDEEGEIEDSTLSDDVYLDIPAAGISDVIGDINAGEARYFNLQGMEVATPASGNIYVRVSAGKATKVLVK